MTATDEQTPADGEAAERETAGDEQLDEQTSTGPGPAVGATLAAITLASKAVRAYGREDLAARVAATRHRIADPAFRVLVVGEFKQGKSSLVNALLNTSVCPVDDDIATSAPTLVQFAKEPSARVIFQPPADTPEADPPFESIPMDKIHDFVTEAMNPANERRVQWVEIGVPSELLTDGLVFVDTPGVGGLGSVHGAITAAALPMADGVLFLSDASQEFCEPELRFLRQAIAMCPNVCCVLTKTDFYPAWRTILELDQKHLSDAGIKARIVPTSSVLRQQALDLADTELDTESGFPELVQTLFDDIVVGSEGRGVIAVASELLSIVAQLESQFQSEARALESPENAEELQRELAAANDRAERLRSQSSRWAQRLGDGIGDLSSDIDYDLRERFRAIVKEADAAIEESDPPEVWDEFEPWLYRRTAEDLLDNFRLLQTRAEELSELVAELFALDQQEVAFTPELGDTTASFRRVSTEATAEFIETSRGQRAMTGVRGGYMGMLMFGALGGMVGLAMGGLPVVAGLVMGRKALRDENDRHLASRRALAKNAVRKYIDEAQFLCGRDSRDTLRRTQRQLRDHYTARAEELQRSVGDAKNAAALALQSDQKTRVTRLRDVKAELERIAGLRRGIEDARALVEPPGGAG